MEQGRIPNSLKKFRKSVGFTQKEVAGILRLQKSSCISRWEKGITLPNLKYVIELSILYRTLPQTLYGDFWDTLKSEILIRERELLAQQESVISSEKYYL